MLTSNSQIRNALNSFASADLHEGCIDLLRQLGVTSNRLFSRTDSGSVQEFLDQFGKDTFRLNARWKKIFSMYIHEIQPILQLTEEESALSPAQGKDGDMVAHSLVFIAVDLKARYQFHDDIQIIIQRIVKRLNKMFSMPTVGIFRQGNKMNLGVSGHRINKISPELDVLTGTGVICNIELNDPRPFHQSLLVRLRQLITSKNKTFGDVASYLLHVPDSHRSNYLTSRSSEPYLLQLYLEDIYRLSAIRQPPIKKA